MIIKCEEHLAAVMKTIGIQTVCTKREDISRHHGQVYGLFYQDEPERLEYDGVKVAKTDDKDSNRRTYIIRVYKVIAKFTVYIAANDKAMVSRLYREFLANLGRYIADDEGQAITVTALSSQLIEDASILKLKTAYEIMVEFTGGIYKSRQVPLIDTIVPEGEITRRS